MYLWNASSGGISTLMQCQEEDEYVTSVSWAADGKHLAVGTSSSVVQIWDADRCKQIRALKGHSARISSLSWNKTTLSSGGKDSLIIHHDVRCWLHHETLKSSSLMLSFSFQTITRTVSSSTTMSGAAPSDIAVQTQVSQSWQGEPHVSLNVRSCTARL